MKACATFFFFPKGSGNNDQYYAKKVDLYLVYFDIFCEPFKLPWLLPRSRSKWKLHTNSSDLDIKCFHSTRQQFITK